MNIELVNTNIQEDEETNYYSFDIICDGQTVGAVSVNAAGEEDDHAYIERMDIDETFRNQGIGTEAIRQLSDKWMGVEAAPDNADCQRLLARLGEESDWDDAPYVDQGYGVYRIWL